MAHFARFCKGQVRSAKASQKGFNSRPLAVKLPTSPPRQRTLSPMGSPQERRPTAREVRVRILLSHCQAALLRTALWTEAQKTLEFLLLFQLDYLLAGSIIARHPPACWLLLNRFGVRPNRAVTGMARRGCSQRSKLFVLWQMRHQTANQQVITSSSMRVHAPQ